MVAPAPAEVAATRARLRDLIRAIESRPPRPPSLPPSPVARMASSTVLMSPAPPAAALEAALPDARWRETAVGTCLVRAVRYPLAAPASGGTEGFDLSALPALGGEPLALLAPDADLEAARPEDLLFLDIETTGLGGAGTMAFLVATGRVEDDAFVLRQYLAPSPPAEGALLEALLADCALSARDPVLVTYNGRRFDAPLLDERATMHRRRAGFSALRHMDLLLPVRTAYRGLLPSCRLGEVERAVLGMARPAAEVPGAEVPAWYFRYLHSGDARLLVPLVEHNARDVVALAALTARLGLTVAGWRRAEGLHALATGRLLAARRRRAAARGHFERAAVELPPGAAQDEAHARLAALHKVEGRRDLAAPLWEAAASRPGAAALRPLLELAVYHEHHRRDPAGALAAVDRALAVVAALERLDAPRAARWRAALLYRSGRLHSRMARSARSR